MKQPPYEILAPAGDSDCMKAAVAAGADAVYFGLSVGFNARAKAPSVALDELAAVMDDLHAREVKGYVALNTLVFDHELDTVERCLRSISEAAADAVIVQDLGVARLAQAIVPDLVVHASTQMTVSSAAASALVEELGVTRITLPRELSIDEIQAFRKETRLELECFVHGSLCISYSGQCLASCAWAQRSANRGLCAQPCRLAYELEVDGHRRPTERKYVLSPKDLAAHSLLGALVASGVTSFKIEGRYKGPDYVAAAVEKYRRALDAVLAGDKTSLGEADHEDLTFTFSRGFGTGWLLGSDHQALCHACFPGHRGMLVGRVVSVRGHRVFVRLDGSAPALKAGDWMVFGDGSVEADVVKGPLFGVGACDDGVLEVRFGRPGPDLSLVRAGDELWKSHDAAVKRRLLRYLKHERKLGVDVVVRGSVGHRLTVAAEDALGRRVVVEGPVLEPAHSRPLNETVVKDKLATFGDTPWYLRTVRLELEGDVATRPSALKEMRRDLLASLGAATLTRPIRCNVVVDRHRLDAVGAAPAALTQPVLVVLCRTRDQVDVALESGCRELCVELRELADTQWAVERCRSVGARVVLPTFRIHKQGESFLDQGLEELRPDGILVRSLGALDGYRRTHNGGVVLHGDFSLNCANSVAGRWLFAKGLATLTPPNDLSQTQFEQLASSLPADRLELVVYQHVALFHSEHCLYASSLSQGHTCGDCGQPCRVHRLSLRDARGSAHPVLVDSRGRNTVFDLKPQSAARHMRALVATGVRRFRIELVSESCEETHRVLTSFRRWL